MTTGSRGLKALLVAVLLATGGCGSAERPDDPSSTAAEVSRKGFDPPRTFDEAAPITLPQGADTSRADVCGAGWSGLPIALHRTTAYLALPNALATIATDTGAITALAEPDHESALPDGLGRFSADAAHPPAVVDVDDTSLVLAAFLVKVPGSGTTPGRTVAELLAVDTRTGMREWNAVLELSTHWANSVYDVAGVSIVGVRERTAVVSVFSSDACDTYAVDLKSRKTLWKREKFRASALTGDAVVGVDDSGLDGSGNDAPDDDQRIVALALSDGSQRWRSEAGDSLAVQSAGPSFVVVTGSPADEFTHFYKLIDAATGAVKESKSAKWGFSMTCRYDGTATTVCHKHEWVAGLDATTGQWLWELPDKAANRIAPNFTTAWHGAVYAETKDGHVVLDARTGKDREARPGAAPVVVNSYVGLVDHPGEPTHRAHKTTG